MASKYSDFEAIMAQFNQPGADLNGDRKDDHGTNTSSVPAVPEAQTSTPSSAQPTFSHQSAVGLFHGRKPVTFGERKNAKLTEEQRTHRGRKKTQFCGVPQLPRRKGYRPMRMSPAEEVEQPYYRCCICLRGSKTLSGLPGHFVECCKKHGNPDGQFHWDDHHTCAFPDEPDYQGPPPG